MVFSTNGAEQLDIHMQKSESRHRPYTLHKNWIIDLIVKGRTVKLLEGNIRENLDDLGYGDVFFRYSTKGTIHEINN